MKVLCVDPGLHLAFSSLFKFISDSGGFTMQVNYNIVHLSLLHIWVHKTTIVFFFIFFYLFSTCTLCWYHKVTACMPAHLYE